MSPSATSLFAVGLRLEQHHHATRGRSGLRLVNDSYRAYAADVRAMQKLYYEPANVFADLQHARNFDCDALAGLLC